MKSLSSGLTSGLKSGKRIALCAAFLVIACSIRGDRMGTGVPNARSTPSSLAHFALAPTPASPEGLALLPQARSHIAAREYWASETSKGLQAPNREHGLRSYFKPTGVRVHDRTGVGSPRLLGLELARIGRGEVVVPVAPGEVAHREGRVEITREKLGLVEWFENTAAGLEQGFTLDRPLAGSSSVGALVLELSVSGAKAALRGEDVFLATEVGRKLAYGKLVAEDADGRRLVAHFEVPKTDRIRLVVDDEGASYPIVIDPLLTETADAQLESNQASAFLGQSVAGAGDVNGDGYDDVIVGAPGYDAGQTNEGAAFVFLGSALGIADGNPLTAAAQLESNQPNALLGESVSGAGDVNGDGYVDVIVGASSYDAGQMDEGAAFVFLGSASGVADGNPGTAAAQIESDQANALLGGSVAGAGDVNGDGYADVIVGAVQYDAGQTDEGTAFLFLGSVSGIADGNPATAATRLESNQTGARLGASVAGAGDVNGDGYADVIVGANLFNAGQPADGAAFVFLGSGSGIANGNSATAATQLDSNQGGAELGGSVAGAGDVNGDGYADVIVGAHYYDAGQTDEGAAFVFLGSASGIADGIPLFAAAQLESDEVSAEMGFSVAGAGDVNGDGYADVIVGTPFLGFLNPGAAFVFLGSTSGVADGNPATAMARLDANLGNSWLGRSVAGAGDINGDGYADVIVGASLYDAGEGIFEGAAFVYHGNPTSLVESVFGFEGTSQLDNAGLGLNYSPPGTMGAVGLTQFVEFTNGSVSVYDKTTGVLQSRRSFQTFWELAGAPDAGGGAYTLGLQRVLFDHYTQRWIASSFGGTADKINIAVSDTSDPLGTWRAVQYAGVAAGGVADFPTLGVDRNGVYIGTNDYLTPTSTFAGTRLTVIPKADLFGGAPTLINRTTFMIPVGGANPRFMIQGAVNWNSSGNSGQFVANSVSTRDLLHFEVDGVDAPGATMSSPTPIGGAIFSDSEVARQPDGTRLVETNNEILTANVVQVGNRIFVTNTVARQSPVSLAFSSVRWQVIDATNGALIDEGDIGGGGFDYYQGSIAVNEFGQAVIGYNRSGPQTADGNADGKPDGRISFMAQTFLIDALGGMDAVGDPLLLRVSDVDDYRCGPHTFIDFCRTRWGDTSAVTIDPSNHRTFYAIGEYAAPWAGTGSSARAVWHTYIAAIRLVPEPGQGAMLMVGLGFISWLERRSRRSRGDGRRSAHACRSPDDSVSTRVNREREQCVSPRDLAATQ